MIQIKREYEKLMQCSLEQHIEVRLAMCRSIFLNIFIQNDTKDEYQEILLELIKDPDQRARRRPRKHRTPTPTRDKREIIEQPEIYREEIIVNQLTSLLFFLK